MALAAVLAGCAGNPIVAIDKPGLTAHAGTGSGGAQAEDLAGARQFALYVRGRYRDEMSAQAQQSQWLNSGLVLLGTAVLGLAAGDAHRDAILGTSLLGGTAFALGSMNLDRRRLMVLSAGIGAIDCATGAVVALDIGAERSRALRDNLAALRSIIDAAQPELQTLKTEINRFGGDTRPEIAAARAVAEAATKALKSAESAHRAGHKLDGSLSTAGRQLQQTVVEITRKVDQAMVDTLVDISAVPQIVAGLGGFAAAFAPGAGIDTQFADSLGSFNAKTKADPAKSGSESADLAGLIEAVTRLEGSTARLKTLTNAVRDEVARVDTAQVGAATQALKACNVAAPAAALAVKPEALSVAAGGTSGFVISGGTRPYSVRLLDGAPEGLSVVFDGGFTDVAHVRLAAGSTATGSVLLLVGDSASPRVTEQVQLTLNPAGTTVVNPTDARTGSVPAPATLAELVTALGSKPVEGASNQVTVRLKSARLADDGQRVDLAVSCEPSVPAKKLPEADVKALLLEADDAVSKLVKRLTDQKVLDAARSQVRVFPAVPNCIKP
jgi:hypothetical protein